MAERGVTHADLDAAVGTPQETSVKLDFTLQAYGRLERKHGELKREVARYREALEEADRWIASVLSVRDELAGDVVLALEKARAALASPPEEQ
jgi:hypothetical protein